MPEFEVMDIRMGWAWICTSLHIFEAIERMRRVHPSDWDFGAANFTHYRVVYGCTHGSRAHLHWMLVRPIPELRAS